ncbi:MAG: peptidoglycan DD-metalloendopeptidase family protein [Gammaproteobacteria bacterium]|nr:peptidoglycan DD-metalloendopeptidase family protein [Gammaproteobacteria bacterium]
MPPNQRPLTRLDVKRLGASPPRRTVPQLSRAPLSPPALRRMSVVRPLLNGLRRRLHRMHLISIGVVAAAAVYLLTIAPSDSTATVVTVPAAAVVAVAEMPEVVDSAATGPATATAATVAAAEAATTTSALVLASVAPVPSPAVPALESPIETVAPAIPAPPVIADEAALPAPPAAPALDWATATVKKRDTLSALFRRHGVRVADAYAVAALDGAERLHTIRPGQEIQLAADADGRLIALRHRLSPLTTLSIRRAGRAEDTGRLRAETVTRAPDLQLRRAAGVISSSLLAAAKAAGLDFETTYAFAHLFDWQVDFAREIRAGDRFSLLFEEQYLDGEKIGNGDIVAAELLTRGRALRAVRHIDEHGRRRYYAPNGDGIQRSFLRSPLEFGRVTSNFSHKRFHPILKKWMPHRGVDYGAARGTPIRATGDGVVTTAKRKYGYGKTVIIRHGEKYTTLYAHLSGYADGVEAGARVAQGDVIGYVGATGWATGPHLHYEFRIRGVHHNPLTVELPKSDPIAARYQAAFVASAARWVARLHGAPATRADSGQVAHLQLDAVP